MSTIRILLTTVVVAGVLLGTAAPSLAKTSTRSTARSAATFDIRSLEQKAFGGDVYAMMELALRYKKGDGVKQDNAASFAWLAATIYIQKNIKKVKMSQAEQKRSNILFEEIFLKLEKNEVVSSGSSFESMQPRSYLSDARNAQRRADVNTIINAIYQYTIDNNGTLPGNIPLGEPTEICKSDARACNRMVKLNLQGYVVSIPHDPHTNPDDNGTHYWISQDVNGRIKVSAPQAENGESINVTR